MILSTAPFGLARWRASAHRPAWWVGWVLAVLLAQGLGQWHRVAHGGPAAGLHPATGVLATAGDHRSHGDASAHPAVSGHAGHGHHAGHAHNGTGLFGQHGEQECRLYDQLACADGLPLAATPCCSLPVQAAVVLALASPTAWLAPRYQRPARAPPLA